MTLSKSLPIARRVISAALLLSAFAVQAQMQTPPPNVPPSAQPVTKPTPPLLPTRTTPSPAPSPELSPVAPAPAQQTPTQLGQPQLNIPLGKKPADTAPSSSAGPAGVAPPAPAASRGKGRPAGARPAASAAECETLVTASARTGCRGGGRASTR